MKRVEITKRWAGREIGTVEDFYDETLAEAVVNGGHGRVVDDDVPEHVQAEGAVEIVPARAMDRAMEQPPRGKKWPSVEASELTHVTTGREKRHCWCRLLGEGHARCR